MKRIHRFINVVILIFLILNFLQISLISKTREINFGQKAIFAEMPEETMIRLGGAKADDYDFGELMNSYEDLLIEAINNNEFSLIKRLLIPGSNIYKAQKKLVADLYKRGIKEKLLYFEMQDTKLTKTDGVYQLYVYENIGIQYPGNKNFVSKEFYWIYTVIVKDDLYRLSDIKKWK